MRKNFLSEKDKQEDGSKTHQQQQRQQQQLQQQQQQLQQKQQQQQQHEFKLIEQGQGLIGAFTRIPDSGAEWP